ncbi:hypothetical protein [Agathobaculum sp.]|uniref:hypothetical protein n=1 Tax=Agathobaculum sp. TaxID=2048138 RepID=UPI002A83F062|nr:hypothetical protein [Agathobaculum sp.]MDY3618634.1 hypothetical protein [Agathobaculum sp.]
MSEEKRDKTAISGRGIGTAGFYQNKTVVNSWAKFYFLLCRFSVIDGKFLELAGG